VFIVLDTARADRFSYAGWPHETTPNIDALTADAVVYSGAHSVAPWTLPSHMSMFTGLFPGQHGATWNRFDGLGSMKALMNQSLRPADPERMLGRRLKDAGYTTVGVSHNPWISERTGFDEGFDALHAAWRESAGGAGTRAERCLALFEQHLGEHGPLGRPAFLFFNFTDPHYPYELPDGGAARFGGDEALHADWFADGATGRPREIDILSGATEVDVAAFGPFYDSALHTADVVVGRLIDWLKAEGRYEGALIVITSDHGEHLGEQGRFSHQLSVEEELLRVPLVIKYPGGAGAGSVEPEALVSPLDLYATLLSAAGDESWRPHSMARDLADMERFDRRRLVAEYYPSSSYLEVLRRSNPAFDVQEHDTVRRAVYEGGHKYVFRDLVLESIDGVPVGAGGAEPDASAQNVTRFLADYVRSVRETVGPQAQGNTDDPELLRALEALGYIGGEDG